MIDGFGALLSAFLLGVVLVKWQSLVGIPIPTLYFLAILPCFFAAYDFFCYLRIKDNFRPFLKVIAFVNMAYCILSLSLAFYHFQSLTYLGWIYIILEIIIVMALATLELKTADHQLSMKKE